MRTPLRSRIAAKLEHLSRVEARLLTPEQAELIIRRHRDGFGMEGVPRSRPEFDHNDRPWIPGGRPAANSIRRTDHANTTPKE